MTLKPLCPPCPLRRRLRESDSCRLCQSGSYRKDQVQDLLGEGRRRLGRGCWTQARGPPALRCPPNLRPGFTRGRRSSEVWCVRRRCRYRRRPTTRPFVTVTFGRASGSLGHCFSAEENLGSGFPSNEQQFRRPTSS